MRAGEVRRILKSGVDSALRKFRPQSHTSDDSGRAQLWLRSAVAAICLGFVTLGCLAIASAVWQWQGFWKAAAQPYATVVTGLVALTAAALALYNGERQRSAEHQRWAADQDYKKQEADRVDNRGVMRDLRGRFVTASDQLSSDSPTIRRSGVYAMGALADDWLDNGRVADAAVCFDVLIAYLREKNAAFSEVVNDAGLDGPVRAAIVAVLASRRARIGELPNPIDVSLRGSDLRGVDFSHKSLCGMNFSEANFRGATLSRCDLSNADFTRCDLRGGYLVSSRLVGAVLVETTFEDGLLTGADLSNAVLQLTNFSKASLTLASLANATGSGVFRDTKLGSCDFTGAELAGSLFARADVDAADVNDTDLSAVTFDEVDVAEFRNLHKARLSPAQQKEWAKAIEASRKRAAEDGRGSAESSDIHE